MRIFCFLLILISATPLFAQNNLGARLSAMGDNGAAVTDIWALQANQAGISGLDRPEISINYIKHLFSNEISTQAFAAVIPFKDNYAGLSFQRYGFSEYNESKVGFAYAKKFGPALSTAINVNYHQLGIVNYGSSKGFSVDVGVLYHYNEQITIGAFVHNPSAQKYDNDQIIAQIPVTFNIGATYSTSDKVLIATTFSKIPKRPLDVKLGIDYKLVDVFSLRGGLSAKPFRQYAGFGLNHKKFLLDMATSYDLNLGYAPQISIGYAF